MPASREEVQEVARKHNLQEIWEMVLCDGPYEYSDHEVLKLTEYLKNCARQQKVVHYDDAHDVVRQFGSYHGPHDQRLGHLLGLISEGRVASGRHALSAIVVVKSEDGANRPGSGFFELEKGLGRYVADDDKTWLAELAGCSGIGRTTDLKGRKTERLKD
jgi:hypothetical protein